MFAPRRGKWAPQYDDAVREAFDEDAVDIPDVIMDCVTAERIGVSPVEYMAMELEDVWRWQGYMHGKEVALNLYSKSGDTNRRKRQRFGNSPDV